MSELEIRQGTVYEENKTGRRLIVVNHNPMALRSFVLASAGKDAPFDIAHPFPLSVESLINMRQSGEWTELGDIPKKNVKVVLRAVLSAKGLPEEDIPFTEAVLKEL